MKGQKHNEMWVSELAGYLNGRVVGADFQVTRGIQQIRSTGEFGNVTALPKPEDDWLLLSNRDTPQPPEGAKAMIVVDAPDQALADLIKEFFTADEDPIVHSTAIISAKAKLGRNVAVGAYSIVGDGVELGNGCEVQHHAVIYGPAVIGRRVVIMDGAIVGNSSYRFAEGTGGDLLQPPQLGNVFIEDGVRIGSHTTIERSFSDDTVIRRQAKIDDLVNIGGGSVIGEKAMITAGCVVGRNVAVGAGVQMGMKSSVSPGLRIAERTVIGQGAVVIHDILVPGVYVGVPAHLVSQPKG